MQLIQRILVPCNPSFEPISYLDVMVSFISSRKYILPLFPAATIFPNLSKQISLKKLLLIVF